MPLKPTNTEAARARAADSAAWIDSCRESQREDPLTVAALLRLVFHLDPVLPSVPRGHRTRVREAMEAGVREYRRTSSDAWDTYQSGAGVRAALLGGE
jgi:hypothetical protein